MDQDEIETAKLEARKAALEARRERLRTYVDSIQDIVESLPAPKTLIEAHRAIRVASSLDRTLVYLYSEPDLRCAKSKERAGGRKPLTWEEEYGEPPQPRTPESLARKQKELLDRIERVARITYPERYAAETASAPSPECTDGAFAESSVFTPPNSDTPISHTSGDATPAPNSATTDLAKADPPPKRSGPSIRSLAPDWPPWPQR